MSVKFPENTPMTVPNLLRFVLQHTGHAPWEEESGTGRGLGRCWRRSFRRCSSRCFLCIGPESVSLSSFPSCGGRTVGSRCTRTRCRPRMPSCRSRAGRLETLYREKTRQLSETVHRLQELADASEELLKENTLLKVLLAVLRERDGPANGEEGKCEAS